LKKTTSWTRALWKKRASSQS
jgi:hypothetical protein